MPSENSIKAALAFIENDKSKVLGLKVGPHTNVETGQYIPRAGMSFIHLSSGHLVTVIFPEKLKLMLYNHIDAQDAPTLSFSAASPTKTYLAISLDIDAPFPSFGVLGPILHWIQPNVTVSGASLKTDGPFVANYIGPAPPPGSSPHRYTFFLYEQPEGFDYKKYAPEGGKTLSNWGRMRYDLDAWAKEIGLGEVVVFNYFTSN